MYKTPTPSHHHQRLDLCLFLLDLVLLEVYSMSILYPEPPELDLDVDGDGVESSSDAAAGNPPMSEKAEPRRCDFVALLYPNLRDAEPLRISGNVMSGVGSRLEPGYVRVGG